MAGDTIAILVVALIGTVYIVVGTYDLWDRWF